MIWDASLISKYNLTGPRYTSYPTAPQFNESISKISLVDKMLAPSDSPLSLYFHIPFCAHLCYYCGCNKIVTKQYDKGDEYVELLGEEMRLRSLMLDPNRQVTQLHFGGGTPTFLREEQLSKLFDYIKEYFNLINDGSQDYSIEIDPREISKSKLELLHRMGINRVSIGVQDFNSQVQKAVHRIQSFELVKDLVSDVRNLGIKSVNFDLIYGLPNQTVEGVRESLKKALSLSPDRISLFNYAHLPERFPAQKRIPAESLPPADSKLAILKMSIQLLIESGYEYIGMDHFAKPTDSLALAQKEELLQRNFQGYTTHLGTELIAFGVSSISNLNGIYIQNHTNLDRYKTCIENGQLAINKGYISDFDDKLRHRVIMTLITSFKLECHIIEKEFDICFHEYFQNEVAKLREYLDDGMLEILQNNNKVTYKVTGKGRLLIRCICMVFDKYLGQNTSYSKVI
ncbi:oxygen-independent coproporphyrinogen III oxidase [Marinomonas sp. C2222]|uniref:Coproporphyrinogen-III oxidase n=1 Tax=Marinomonas sargassi TaxID=2984494 RepID=A0ABT2YT49_9GAMM|nr:oxygen-independent coproporphyrinogen III oxidase [Marinomonas sargassi]MCV2402794.1 oxygen-independent coproporphyrinogen III oxidase [Marinomonas sargassi]